MKEMASKDPPWRSIFHNYYKIFIPLIQTTSKHIAQDDCSHHLDCFLVFTCGRTRYERKEKKHHAATFVGIDGLPE
jgi:hypothetical protein